jgi:ElaB/YqjD/DUF883 family membrane-anchored ribosome-binding protein
MSNEDQTTGEGIPDAVDDAVSLAGTNPKLTPEERTSGVGETVRKAAAQAAQAIDDGCKRLADKSRDVYEHGSEKARNWDAAMGNRMQRHPVSSLLMAVGVGVVVGYLISGKGGNS